MNAPVSTLSDAEPSVLELVPRSPHARIVALLVGLTALALLLSLVFVPWQQSASGSGRVVAWSPQLRTQQVEAPLEGRVQRWNVREGSRVRAGELLVELADNDPAVLAHLRAEREAVLARLVAARARVEALEARRSSLGDARGSALEAASARVRMAAQRVRAAEQAEEATEAAQETARRNHERQRELARQGLASTRTAELAELEHTRARTEHSRAEAALAAARSELLALRSDQLRAQSDLSAGLFDATASRASASAEVEAQNAELARLDVRLARQQNMLVRAPLDGTVLRLSGGVGGEMVRAGDSLLTLVPDTSERAVELYVDGNDMPLLAEGREVRLQFEGWPAVQFVGWPSVAVGTFAGRVALLDATDDGRGRFRVLVTPAPNERWPDARYLRQGVRANGWVLLERVRLGYELWRRLNGFPPAVPAPAASSGASYGGSSR